MLLTPVMTQADCNKTRLCHTISLGSKHLKGITLSRQEEMGKALMPERWPRTAQHGSNQVLLYKIYITSA